MNTPIIIPVTRNTGPDTCPECGKEKNKIETCKHCGYKYPKDEKLGFWNGLLLTILVVSFFLVFFTLIAWLLDFSNPTLVEFLNSQWDEVTSKRLW